MSVLNLCIQFVESHCYFSWQCIGATGDGAGRWFPGMVDEVRIWSCARKSSDIKLTMRRTVKSDDTHLQAYFGLNEGSGRAVFDLSKNNLVGTFVGRPQWQRGGAPVELADVQPGLC